MTLAEALRSPTLKRVWPWIWTAPLVILLLEAQAVAPVGRYALLYFELPYVWGALTAFIAALVLPFRLFDRHTRMLRLAWLLAALVYLALVVSALRIGWLIRYWAFDRLALRSTTLISAIRDYESKHGEPPPRLESLVPAYFPEVPRTGIMAYPSYQYHAGRFAQVYDENPWVLVVETPGGCLNFDSFIYFPLQNYPALGYGGRLERIRDWAYVHE